MSFIADRLVLPETGSRSRDDVLAALALTLVTLADGGLDEEEEALLDSWKEALPDWHEHAQSAEFMTAVETLLTESLARYQAATGNDTIEPAGFALAAVDELAELEDPRRRQRVFLLCVDMAMTAGGVTETEDAVLEKIASTFQLEAPFVDQVVSLMALKYGA